MSGAVVASVVVAGLLAQRRPGEPVTGQPLPVPAPEPTDEPVEVVYCAGWDPAARAPVAPMAESVARAQDAAGGQYAVVLFVGGVARAVVEVCWAAHHAEVWHVDAAGRRYRGVAYRRWPDGRLRLFEVRGWHHAEEGAPESDRAKPAFRARVRRAATAVPEWVKISVELAGGGSMQTTREWQSWPEPARPPDDVPVPAVDGWPELAGMTGPRTVRSGPEKVPATFPWRPPRPLRPRHIDLVVTDAARLRAQDGREFVVKRVPAGRIRLPSGRLLVGDPHWLDGKSPPLTAAVAPGEYAVDVFQLVENGSASGAMTAACRVTVADAPVTSWHLAMRDGDHELDLGDGEFPGNPVDTATLALVDHTGATAYQRADIEAATAGKSVHHTLSSAQTGTDMVIVPGWSDGACPVWLGRTENGVLACYVLDFLLPELATAEPA